MKSTTDKTVFATVGFEGFEGSIENAQTLLDAMKAELV